MVVAYCPCEDVPKKEDQRVDVTGYHRAQVLIEAMVLSVPIVVGSIHLSLHHSYVYNLTTQHT